MAYDSNPAATHDPSTGGTPTAAWGDILNANFAYLGAAWTSFSSWWKGSVADPAIGNGSIAAGYVQVGKTLYVRYWIKMGSTTTFGTGNWRLVLPNSLTVSTARTQSLHAHAVDSSASTFYVGGAHIGETPGINDRFELGFHGAGITTPTVPFTWATGDTLVVEGVLEVA